VVAIVAAIALYRFAVPGLSSARKEPPEIEVAAATFLLHASVPAADRARTNPFGQDRAAITAGQDLFRQKCEICHAYDGSGKPRLAPANIPDRPLFAR
jgi:cytochrome c5